MPAVVGDHHTGFRVFSGFQNIVRDSLCGTAHCQPVHTVSARPADASEACRSKYDLLIELIYDLLFILCSCLKLRVQRIVCGQLLQPEPV